MLVLSDLRKSYGALRAGDGLRLAVRRGEAFALLGPNGAGKTTTISICTGLLRPDSGSVQLDGTHDPAGHAARRRMGIAPQELALYDDLTAAENLAFFGRVHGLRGKRLRQRVDAELEAAGLTDRARSRVDTFSGGMKRRLNLAAALVHEPELVFLDEPTVGVDPQSRNALLERIRALRDAGLTVIYSTHYMEEVEKLCDRVAIVDHGKLVALGTVDELVREHGGPPVITARVAGELVSQPTTDPAKDLAALAARGAVEELRLDRPGLEAVFLNLTGRRLRD